MEIIISALIGYLLGCIQMAYIMGKIVGHMDIRKHGSGNSGASNVVALLGWKYGIITALVDIVKAVVAVLIVRALYPGEDLLHYLAGSMAVLGHIYPFFMGFRGGKGAASLVGMALALDLRIGGILVLAIVLVTVVTDYIAIGSLVMYTLFPLLTYWLGYPRESLWLTLLLAVVGFWKHRINIVRILRREERGLRSVLKK